MGGYRRVREPESDESISSDSAHIRYKHRRLNDGSPFSTGSQVQSQNERNSQIELNSQDLASDSDDATSFASNQWSPGCPRLEDCALDTRAL